MYARKGVLTVYYVLYVVLRTILYIGGLFGPRAKHPGTRPRSTPRPPRTARVVSPHPPLVVSPKIMGNQRIPVDIPPPRVYNESVVK